MIKCSKAEVRRLVLRCCKFRVQRQHIQMVLLRKRNAQPAIAAAMACR